MLTNVGNRTAASYVALLRGINVGKNKRIDMVDLRALAEGLGYTHVRTYLNSGNVIFTAPEQPNADLAAALERAIPETLGMEVPVLVRSAGQMRAIVEGNPFPERTADPATLHVAFLAHAPDDHTLQELATLEKGEDDYRVIGDTLYLSYPNKLTGAVLVPGTLTSTSTSRNWRTVTALAEMTSS